MLRPIDQFFENKEEPVKSCLQFLRSHILKSDPCLTEAWRYGMPFYLCNGKRFCYLWVHKKTGQPYIGIVDGNKVTHPDLIKENRTRMKIMLIDPSKTIPLKKIDLIIKTVIR